jgi:hypothetical protein
MTDQPAMRTAAPAQAVEKQACYKCLRQIEVKDRTVDPAKPIKVYIYHRDTRFQPCAASWQRARPPRVKDDQST